LKVDADACRGPRKDYTTKEEERIKERQARRLFVLDKKAKLTCNEMIL
jgi:hypothetical protein